MEKYKRYHGIAVFIAIVVISIFISYKLISPRIELHKEKSAQIEKLTEECKRKENQLNIVKNKIKKIKDSITGSKKRIYSPVDSDLGNDTLFFTLYNDVIEMIHNNSIKIKAIDYVYNPESDAFVEFGKDVYFVCDINMELVSDYTNLGKLIQDIYQYPYYIKINSVKVNPYQKDKKVLITNMSLRLYAHTEPDTQIDADIKTEPIQ